MTMTGVEGEKKNEGGREDFFTISEERSPSTDIKLVSAQFYNDSNGPYSFYSLGACKEQCMTIMILTAVKVRTLCNVAIGSENQLHILDNAL